ncbi:MAG TPA: putative quinol monooxygenase [Bryobacteraceae bacterium]|nr:putative quinol monooxygenase [Bryobacteraceae bacterium]
MSEETKTDKIDVVAHIHAAPGHEAVVREALESFVAPTRQEEGCLRYDLFQDLSDPLKFTFIEEWTSQAALEQHSRSAHIAAGRARMEGKLSGPSWVQVARRIL